MRGIVAIGLLMLLGGCGPAQRDHNIRQVASYYHVRPGDTLYTIAWRYALDVRELMAWNGLKPPYTIHPGQRLRLSPPPGYRPPVRRPVARTPQVATRPTSPPAPKPATPSVRQPKPASPRPESPRPA